MCTMRAVTQKQQFSNARTNGCLHKELCLAT